jgi:hypothetical protein
MYFMFSADKLDGIKEMSDPFVDGRVDARVGDWYATHKPVVEVRKSHLSSEVSLRCRYLNVVFVFFKNSTSICGMEPVREQARVT